MILLCPQILWEWGKGPLGCCVSVPCLGYEESEAGESEWLRTDTIQSAPFQYGWCLSKADLYAVMSVRAPHGVSPHGVTSLPHLTYHRPYVSAHDSRTMSSEFKEKSLSLLKLSLESHSITLLYSTSQNQFKTTQIQEREIRLSFCWVFFFFYCSIIIL